ncbi:MAG: dihydroorotate dehydrogenase [Chloroflexi bacterium]|nr:dihydroorotate dehydrogenase [Chloroflexota bacterium]
MSLAVDLAPRRPKGLRLRNPVLTASGCFGYGTEYGRLIDIQRLGAIVSKGTTPLPRKGNPMPRLVETPSGLINSIGLQNVGVEAVVREKAPIWARWQVPVIVNIAGTSVDEYATMAETLEGVPGVAGIEINVSSPNFAGAGMEFGRDAAMSAEVTAAVRSVTTLPVIVKLTPNVTDIVSIARAAVEAGADALTVANTLVGMAIDIRTRRPILPNVRGGVSGPAIKPVALYMVYQVAGAVDVPVIASGGIMTWQDALEFILAGALAVQIGTATFVRPTAALEVVDGLAAYLEREGIEAITELVGAARR